MSQVQAAKPVVSAITLAYGAATTVSQLHFAVSIAFETLPLMANNPKFKMSQFARQVEEASAYTICARTVANVGSVASHLQSKFGAKIGSYADGLTQDNVLAFADFLRHELSATDYTLTLGDISAFCKGELSSAGKRKKAEDERAAAAAALAQAAADKEAAKLTEQVDAQLSAAEKAKKDAEAAAAAEAKKAEAAAAEAEAAKLAKAEADKRAAQIAEAARIQAAAAAAEAEAAAAAQKAAEEARKQAESFAVRIGVKQDGSPDIVVALNPSPAFLEEAAKQLKAMAQALRKQQRDAMKIAA